MENLEGISKKNKKIHLGEIDINSFYDNFLKLGIYDEDIQEHDLEARYKRCYEIFKHNDGKPLKITPSPISPENILEKKEIGYTDVIDVEMCIAIQWTMGLSVLKSIFPNADCPNSNRK